ncbi:potassium transporter [Burkholderia sp. YI23]|nr:potassium transporter [Burkholderia sp. YI23]
MGSTAPGVPADDKHAPEPHGHPALLGLSLAALGVVYGDIGTSPLYTLKTVFDPAGGLPLQPANVIGIVSLIFWSLTVIVSLKYVTLILRANNHGEGGIMALLALAASSVESKKRLKHVLLLIGVMGAALFYGDGVITPAISVLSAVEGLEVAAPMLQPYVVPLTLVALIALFVMQKHGTSGIGAVFGPVMVLWFIVLAVSGIVNIKDAPHILTALNPLEGLAFGLHHRWLAFVALGAVVLSLTGAEALYADMGHFGSRPIRLTWFAVVFPALALNYLGQGALLIADPSALQNPFYRLFPSWMLYPMVVLSTIATVIASQAVISGTYSMTKQAMQLGFLPRMSVVYTSAREIGQIYVPGINWTLLLAVVAAVLGFGSSTALGSAYGIAVTGTMLITTVLTFFVIRYAWGYNWALCLFATSFFFIIDFIVERLMHNRVLHEHTVFLTVATEPVPWVDEGRRVVLQALGEGCFQVTVNYGFKDEVDLPAALEKCRPSGVKFDRATSSYFLSRATVVPTPGTGMALWRERLFAIMLHNVGNVAAYLRLPADRVIELGARVEI